MEHAARPQSPPKGRAFYSAKKHACSRGTLRWLVRTFVATFTPPDIVNHLTAAIAFLSMLAPCVAAPGGHLVDAISDEFDTLSPMWTPGLRGMPEFLTIQTTRRRKT
jgi:hypothetical protein